MKAIFVLTLIVGMFSTGVIGSAQAVVTTSGGTAIGSAGSATFTAGQLSTEIFTGPDGSIAHGVQQPFEISVVTTYDYIDMEYQCISAYPNPTNETIILSVDLADVKGLLYELRDFKGTLLEKKNLETHNTEISTGSYPSGIFFLRVIKGGISISVFRIVKK